MGRTQRFGKGRLNLMGGAGAQGTGFAATGLVLALTAQADAQAELVPTVSNAGVAGAKLAADGTLQLALTDGQSLVLTAEQFTIAADGSVVLTDAVVQQIATLLGIEATGLGVTLVPLAGAGGLGLALAGGGGTSDGGTGDGGTTPTPGETPAPTPPATPTPVANTPAVVGGTTTRTLTEDAGAILTTGGKLTVTDPDAGQASFLPGMSMGRSAGFLGTFNIKTDGTWTYEVPNAAVQTLGQGETRVESFDVSTIDGTKQTLSVTITGTNDAAVITGQDSAFLGEHAAVPAVSGTLTVTDADRGQAMFLAQENLSGAWGTASIDAAGNWTYTMNRTGTEIPGLRPGDTLEDHFIVHSIDGTPHQVDITIIGTPAFNEFDLAIVSADSKPGFVIFGSGENTQSGFSITNVGDVNGDGFDDVFVAQKYADGSAARSEDSFIVFGKDDINPIELSAVTSGIGGFVIQGRVPPLDTDTAAAVDAPASMGVTISKLGDINGDGLADLLISTAETGGDSYGTATAHIVFGKTDTDAVDLSNLIGDDAGFSITGIPVSDLGIRIAGGGDINGDGFDDYLLSLPQSSAPYAPPAAAAGPDPDGTAATMVAQGRVYAIFGGPSDGAIGLSDIDAGKGGGFKITHAETGDNFGVSVAILGDVNGDGKDDIAIGAPKTSDGTGEAGSVTVVFGKADTEAVATGRITEDGAGFVISGAGSNARLGSTVAAAGDVNGDGLADIFVGSSPTPAGAGLGRQASLSDDEPLPPGTGADALAYVVLGQSIPQDVVLSDGIDSRVLTLATYDAEQTWAISGAGDVDGDGMDDLIIGVYTNAAMLPFAVADGSLDSGPVKDTTYVISGALLAEQKSIVLDDSLVATPGTALIYQTTLFDGHGLSVSGGGDVNGDGFADLIIGAPYAGPNGVYSGQTSVGFGRVLAATSDGVQIGGTDNDTLTGTFADERLIGGAGDDLLDATQGGAVLIGGAGDDVLVTGGGIVRIDGGTGRDTLSLGIPSEWAFDLTVFGDLRVQSIEVIDLGRKENTLRIDESEVLRLSESTNTLRVLGGEGDHVALVGLDWQQGKSFSENGIAFDVFISGNARVELAQTVGHSGGPIPVVTVTESVNGLFGGFIINGQTGGDEAGYSVSLAGDVNGDGLDDIVLGAIRDDASDLDAGAGYVVFGKAFGATVDLGDVGQGDGGFIMTGEYAYDNAGTAVSGLGDINGDGLDDILISAPGYDVSYDGQYHFNVGSIYVVYGKDNGTAVSLDDVGDGRGGMVIDGVLADEGAGVSVSGAGDVNGDGIADILIGVPFSTAHAKDSGAAYVVFGSTDDTFVSLSDLEADTPTGGFAIHGLDPGDLAGISVRDAGDVNGDGLDDVIIGARGAGDGAGAGYVVFGKTSTDMIHLDEIEDGTGGFAILGVTAGDDAGQSVSGLGDINGDGLDDLLIGAPYATGGATQSGMAFVVYGKEDGTEVKLTDVANGLGGFAIRGDAAYANTGFSVSAAGDVNGDGWVDLLIGSYTADGGAKNSGLAYLVFGRPDADTVDLADIRDGHGGFAIHGRAQDDAFGYSVGGGGDINGDGFDDLVIGMPGNATNGDYAGGAVVVFGGNFTGAVSRLGDAGDNVILGTTGNEILFGAQGDDMLFGGGGVDRLSGGAGADQFVIIDAVGRTTVVDFDGDAGDQLVLSSFNLSTFAEVQNRLSVQNGDTRLALDDNTTVILSGLDPDVLTASHVIL